MQISRFNCQTTTVNTHFQKRETNTVNQLNKAEAQISHSKGGLRRMFNSLKYGGMIALGVLTTNCAKNEGPGSIEKPEIKLSSINQIGNKIDNALLLMSDEDAKNKIKTGFKYDQDMGLVTNYKAILKASTDSSKIYNLTTSDAYGTGEFEYIETLQKDGSIKMIAKSTEMPDANLGTDKLNADGTVTRTLSNGKKQTLKGLGNNVVEVTMPGCKTHYFKNCQLTLEDAATAAKKLGQKAKRLIK